MVIYSCRVWILTNEVMRCGYFYKTQALLNAYIPEKFVRPIVIPRSCLNDLLNVNFSESNFSVKMLLCQIRVIKHLIWIIILKLF